MCIRDRNNSLQKDMALGYTSIGPHRADIQFRINDTDIKHVASMSTQIILSLVYILSQAREFHVKHQHNPVILIDDIFFGIDDKNLAIMLKLLSNSGAQCFLTAPDLYTDKVKKIDSEAEIRLFHLNNMNIEVVS